MAGSHDLGENATHLEAEADAHKEEELHALLGAEVRVYSPCVSCVLHPPPPLHTLLQVMSTTPHKPHEPHPMRPTSPP